MEGETARAKEHVVLFRKAPVLQAASTRHGKQRPEPSRHLARLRSTSRQRKSQLPAPPASSGEERSPFPAPAPGRGRSQPPALAQDSSSSCRLPHGSPVIRHHLPTRRRRWSRAIYHMCHLLCHFLTILGVGFSPPPPPSP